MNKFSLAERYSLHFESFKKLVDSNKPKSRTREEYDKEYRNLPESKLRAKEYRERQEVKDKYRERKRLWMVEYRKRPGIIEKERKYARDRKRNEKAKLLDISSSAVS